LAAFQRRLIFISFARWLPAAVAAAFVAFDAVLLAAHPPLREALIWLAAAMTLAVTATGVVAFVNVPSLPATARILDRRFHLEDRVVTALEFSGHVDLDLMSRLIVADAGSKLAAHPARDLSFDPMPRLRWLSAGIATCALVAAILLSSARQTRADIPGQPFADSAVLSAGEAGASSRTSSTSPTQEAPAPGATTDGRATASQSADTEATERSPRREAVETTRRDAGSRDASGAPQGYESASPSRKADAGTDATETAGPGRSTPSRSRDAALNVAALGGGRSGVAAGQPSGPAVGQGAGTGLGLGRGGGAGGVRQGSLTERTNPPATPKPPDAADDAANYRSALRRAESAIAEERIPAARRAYVREYFLAIRPPAQP
jgi:hypothetical protein